MDWIGTTSDRYNLCSRTWHLCLPLLEREGEGVCVNLAASKYSTRVMQDIVGQASDLVAI